MKKFISIFLCIALLVMIVPSTYADFSEKKEFIYEKTKEVIKHGEVIGTSHVSYYRVLKDTSTDLIKETEIHYNDGTITNDTEVTTFIIKNNEVSEILINGEKSNDTFDTLVSQLDSQLEEINILNNNQWDVIDGNELFGYIEWEDRFYNFAGNPLKTYLKTANGIKNRLTTNSITLDIGGASNTTISRTVETSGIYALDIRDFKHYVRDVQSSHDDILEDTALLGVALGGAVTAAIIAGIATGTIAASGAILVYAISIWNSSGDAGETLELAYELLEGMTNQ